MEFRGFRKFMFIVAKVFWTITASQQHNSRYKEDIIYPSTRSEISNYPLILLFVYDITLTCFSYYAGLTWFKTSTET